MEAKNTRILVCDDELDVRDMVKEYLGKKGYSVTTAPNAQQLRAILASGKVDLIILDINMPVEDGLTALRSLRLEDSTPVIMMTAAGETVDRIIGLEMGADDYLGKPVDLRELEARIKAVLRRRKGEREPARQSAGAAMFGDCTLDIAAAKLIDQDGPNVALPALAHRLVVPQELQGSALQVVVIEGLGFLLALDVMAEQRSQFALPVGAPGEMLQQRILQ